MKQIREVVAKCLGEQLCRGDDVKMSIREVGFRIGGGQNLLRIMCTGWP